MKPIFSSVVVAVAANPLMALSAQASLVRDAALEDACRGDVPVVVYSGMGATVDFTQTGKVVQRAWLGDPSRVTLDADRPIEQGSSVLFLRRVEGLSFEGLPSAASTVLTTVLVSANGSEVCQFPISYSTGTPAYTSLRLTTGGGTATTANGDNAARSLPGTILPSSIDVNSVETGINLNAFSLGESNQVVVRVREFIARVRDGAEQRSTAQELGIEWPLIIELNRQGSAEPVHAETIFL